MEKAYNCGMEYVYVIRNNLKRILQIEDLVGNDGKALILGPFQAVGLHNFFPAEQVMASEGLKEAIREKYVTETTRILPPVIVKASTEEPKIIQTNNAEVADLQSKIDGLATMLQTMMTQQPVVQQVQSSPSDDILSQIAKKLDALQAPKKTGPAGFQELNPEMAAVKAHERREVAKTSNFDVIGDSETINDSQSQNMLDELSGVDLSDIDLDEV